MPHVDPDQLALVALGEQLSDDRESAHLLTCAQCAAELEELEHTAQVGRASIDGTLETPSPRVWRRITDELGMTVEAEPGEAGEVPPLATLRPLSTRADMKDAATRRRPWVWVLAAAAAIALVAGVGVGLTAWLRAPVTELASATLDPLPDHPEARGSAALDERADGSRVLSLSLDSPTTAGYREVWLMNTDASALVSLGLLDGTSGDFVIPKGIDLDQYPLVDISAEPTDGDPAHSGDSIVRGQLRFG